MLDYKLTIPIYDYTSIPNFPNLRSSLEIVVNIMITIINQAKYLQQKLVNSLIQKHKQEGGFTENLLKQRLAIKKDTKYINTYSNITDIR